MSLHTRSLKYGKLQGGVLALVTPSLVKRLKQHFHRFEFGVDVIFAMNGYVWVSPSPEGAARPSDEAGGGMLNDAALSEQKRPDASLPRATTREVREKVSRVHNSVVALDAMGMAVSPTTVAAVYYASGKMLPKDMLLPYVVPEICASVMACWPEPTLALSGE